MAMITEEIMKFDQNELRNKENDWRWGRTSKNQHPKSRIENKSFFQDKFYGSSFQAIDSKDSRYRCYDSLEECS